MTSEPDLLDFEAALSRLEAVVSSLESGELTLAESLRAFEEGISLSRRCAERLDQAEARIELLIRTTEGELATEPFSRAGDAPIPAD
jgi:exodeoxyribonuclease VII small subunit